MDPLDLVFPALSRERVASKIEEAIQRSNISTLRNGEEMEQHIFEKSLRKDEYYLFIAQLISTIREYGLQLNLDLIGVELPIVDPLNDIPVLAERGPSTVPVLSRRQLEDDLPPNMTLPSMRSGSILAPGGRSAQSEKYKGDCSWKTPAFRKGILSILDETMDRYGRPTLKNSIDMERHLFEKAKTREEYTGFVKRVILHIQGTDSQSDKSPVSGISDLIPDSLGSLIAKKKRRICRLRSNTPRINSLKLVHGG